MQAPQSQSRFSALVKFRAPVGLREAIDVVARREHTTFSEWARRTLIAALRADGVHIGTGGRVTKSTLRCQR